MLVYSRLLTKHLHGKAKRQNLFVQGYNHTYLEVDAVMKHAQKHHIGTALLITSRVQARVCVTYRRTRKDNEG